MCFRLQLHSRFTLLSEREHEYEHEHKEWVAHIYMHVQQRGSAVVQILKKRDLDEASVCVCV
jgi:hypothetical protein